MDDAHASYDIPITPEDLGRIDVETELRIEDKIRIRAYERYQERGYLDGFDLEDWIAAEREIMGEE